MEILRALVPFVTLAAVIGLVGYAFSSCDRSGRF